VIGAGFRVLVVPTVDRIDDIVWICLFSWIFNSLAFAGEEFYGLGHDQAADHVGYKI